MREGVTGGGVSTGLWDREGGKGEETSFQGLLFSFHSGLPSESCLSVQSIHCLAGLSLSPKKKMRQEEEEEFSTKAALPPSRLESRLPKKDVNREMENINGNNILLSLLSFYGNKQRVEMEKKNKLPCRCVGVL